MAAELLTARPVVEKIKQDLIKRCENLKKRGITPSMSVVLVGSHPASLTYIRNKQKICEEVGAKFSLRQFTEDVSPDVFSKEMQTLNQDSTIHGIIIQLPVSEKLKKLDIANLVAPAKDIDGFNGSNTLNLYQGSVDLHRLIPCTPKGIIYLLQHYGIQISGKHVVMIGRSHIVGKPLGMLLTNMNATVTLAHSKTKDLPRLTKAADIVVSAIGVTKFLKKEHFDPKTKTVVIDVGINSLDGKLCGDVDLGDVKDVVSAITPVPGGVGPMTVVSLIENLITACENQSEGKL